MKFNIFRLGKAIVIALYLIVGLAGLLYFLGKIAIRVPAVYGLTFCGIVVFVAFVILIYKDLSEHK